MKTSHWIFAVILLIAALSGCSNPNRVLPKKEGMWKVISVSDQVFQGNGIVIDTTFVQEPTEMYEFLKEGVGVFSDDGVTKDFTWNYDKEVKEIRISFTSPLLIWDFQVVKSKRKEQTWLRDEGIPRNSPDRTERTFVLERID